MKSEFSTGGVLVKRYKNGWKLLVLKDKKGNWTFPKGHKEKGEADLVAAKREIAEEAGIQNITHIADLSPISYHYNRNQVVHKKVRYFLFEVTGDEVPVPQLEEGITAISWISLAAAYKKIGYPKTNTPILDEVKKILSGL